MFIRDRQDVKELVLSKGHDFFDNSVNLIGVRKDNFFDNGFTDSLYIPYTDHKTGEKKLEVLPWTTLAGSLGRGGALDPLTVGGVNIKTGKWEVVTGVAVLKAGQYKGAYEFRDSYFGWLSYPYFYQAKEVLVYRDGNKDKIFDRDPSVPIHRGHFGINIHRMSNNGVKQGFVNAPGVSWSQGCQGAIEPEFKKLLNVVRKDVPKFGKFFTYTLIDLF